MDFEDLNIEDYIYDDSKSSGRRQRINRNADAGYEAYERRGNYGSQSNRYDDRYEYEYEYDDGFEEYDDGYYYDDDDYYYDEPVKKRNKRSAYNKKGKKKKRWVKPLVIILVILAVLALAAFIFLRVLFGGMKTNKLDKNELGITQTEFDKRGIKNIVLFGVDTRDVSEQFGDQNRSDSIIIATLDSNTDEIKLTSILRDSKVAIEGYGEDKINTAYRYGGPQLALKTINQNFKMDLTDYITVNFDELATIVDSLGGLDLEITQEEADNMALTCPEKPVSAGYVHLDGDQAVAYSRVRKIDSDYNRASRQQIVLSLILDKIKQMPILKYPSFIQEFLSCVETSLSSTELIGLGTKFNVKDAQLVRNTIPDTDYESDVYGGLDETGSWVWIYDLDEASHRLHNIIYGGE